MSERQHASHQVCDDGTEKDEVKTYPGSQGEHSLQKEHGTTKRANSFYDRQVLDHLNPSMQEFIQQQEMVFVATADAHGECDCSFRAGSPGFIHVLDETSLTYPEYRGNGVMASLGNITENAHIGLMFVDFFRDTIGLHVNGKATIVENEELLERDNLPTSIVDALSVTGGKKPERWVMVAVEEAYIHCSKHIPLLKRQDKEIDWGTDDMRKKGGDYFNVSQR